MPAGLFLVGLAGAVGNATAMPWMTFLAGLFTGAALVSTPALAAAFYPTAARASGVAWMTGVGRLGGIGGAYVGAVLLAHGFTISQVLQCLALPAMFAAAAIAIKGLSASTAPVLQEEA